MDKCYFCVFTKKYFRVCVIVRDQAFIDSMIEKLNNFFDKFFKDIVSERYIYTDTMTNISCEKTFCHEKCNLPTARVILRRVVHRWRNQCILGGPDSAL